MVSVSQNPFGQYQPADEDADGDPSYFGFLDKFGNWYIQKYDMANGQFRYVRGSTQATYLTAWTGRATETYDHFDTVFNDE